MLKRARGVANSSGMGGGKYRIHLHPGRVHGEEGELRQRERHWVVGGQGLAAAEIPGKKRDQKKEKKRGRAKSAGSIRLAEEDAQIPPAKQTSTGCREGIVGGKTLHGCR